MSVAKAAATGQAPPFPDPIPGIIHFSSLNILAGSSGVGKTCLMSWMLTKFRDGTPLFGQPVHTPTKIGYLCADRGWMGARYWLTKAGYGDIAFYSLADDPKFTPTRLRNKNQLTAILSESFDLLSLPPGALVVVDPLALFMGGSPNDYHAVAVACLEIRRLLTARQITLLGLAHASKQRADKKDRYLRLQDRILGSAANLGYADTQMYLAAPEETGEKFYTFLWHPHTAPAQHFPLGRDKDGMFVPWAESIQAAEEGSILANIPEDGSEVTYQLLTQVAGVAQSTLFRKLNEMISEGLIERSPTNAGAYRRRKPS